MPSLQDAIEDAAGSSAVYWPQQGVVTMCQLLRMILRKAPKVRTQAYVCYG